MEYTCEQAEQQLAEMVKNIEWTYISIKNNDCFEFLITLPRGNPFKYIMGLGLVSKKDFHKWVQHPISTVPAHDLYGFWIGQHGKLYTDSQLFIGLKETLDKKVKPKLTDIIFSLCIDAQSSDLDFEEWTNEYGYDSDSIKAIKVWKACNVYRRHLQRLFSKDDINFMYDLSNHM